MSPGITNHPLDEGINSLGREAAGLAPPIPRIHSNNGTIYRATAIPLCMCQGCGKSFWEMNALDRHRMCFVHSNRILN